MSPFLTFGIPFVLGIVATIIYNWKISPIITKAHRRAEQREREEEAERAREKQAKLDRLNAQWSRNREALSQMERPLKGFNEMNRYQDIYFAQACSRLAEVIEMAAKKLEGDGYEDIKARLLEYAGRRDRINDHTGFLELKNLFQRLVGDAYEPMILLRDVRRLTEQHKVPPFSEKDV